MSLFKRWFSRTTPAGEGWFDTRAVRPSSSVSIREQLVGMNRDLKELSVRVANLGRSIRVDGTIISVDDPGPVTSLQDAIEYLNTRIDLIDRLVESVEEKLGF